MAVESQETEVKLRTYAITANTAPRVLVVFCGDPRFQSPVRQFLEKELGFKEGEYLPLVIRGGVASMLLSGFLPKEAKYVNGGIGDYLRQFESIERVILINHEDCGKYKILQRTAPFLITAGQSLTEKSKSDLALVKHLFGTISPRQVQIDTYFAKFANPNHTEVVFEKQ